VKEIYRWGESGVENSQLDYRTLGRGEEIKEIPKKAVVSKGPGGGFGVKRLLRVKGHLAVLNKKGLSLGVRIRKKI